MADETENLTLRLLREIRAELEVASSRLEATNAKLDGFMTEQRAANAKLEWKLDKLSIELIGVKGRVRKVEEAIESIARVMSDGALG
jgi:predicted  nucleic acid-binding Zn-ribbon protein